MSRAIIIAAIAGLALSGCVTRTMDAPASYSWTYSANPDEGAKLAFGRPQSDEVVLMMVCDDSRIMLSAAGLNSPRLILDSGETRTSIDGVIGEGFAGAPGLIEASASMRTPALEAFSQSGDLDLTSGGRTIRMTASDADRPAVKRFFRACQA
jgi:hypothetical protein